jgi:cytochrome c biogenesis protein CcmG/thiol:disulfide interchange protein DsbE
MSARPPASVRSRHPARSGPGPLLLMTLALVIVAGLAAFVVTLVSQSEASETAFDTSAAVVEGSSLVPLPETGDDPAVGHASPVIEGMDDDGNPVSYPATGRPTVLLFLAHWCPHCRAELPVVQDWVDEGNLPKGVDLVGVATTMDPDRPNYPPSEWLEEEGWTGPTVADAGGGAVEAFGLSAFPFWVALDADGRVVERRTGELTHHEIDDLVATVAD